jgi:hypothetical protein
VIATLISARLVEAPELRQSKDGHVIAFAFIRARVGKNATETWQIHVHDRAAQGRSDALERRGLRCRPRRS